MFSFCSKSGEWAERREAALRRLAELGMELAEDMAARAKGAETIPEAERCAAAFDRLARAVRLTFSVQSRLQLQDRQGRLVGADSFAARSQLRRKQVRAMIAPTLRAEVPDREYEQLVDELDQRLWDAALFEDFVEGPLAVQVARIRRDLGLVVHEDAAANDLSSPGGLAAGGPQAVATGPP